MLGALEKWLATKAAQVGKVNDMPLKEIVSALGSKGKDFAKSTYGMAKAHPGESAALAGLGGVAGAMGSGGEPDGDEDEEKLLRAYGIR